MSRRRLTKLLLAATIVVAVVLAAVVLRESPGGSSPGSAFSSATESVGADSSPPRLTGSATGGDAEPSDGPPTQPADFKSDAEVGGARAYVRVIEARSAQPVEGCEILLADPNETAGAQERLRTDADGLAAIPAAWAGRWARIAVGTSEYVLSRDASVTRVLRGRVDVSVDVGCNVFVHLDQAILAAGARELRVMFSNPWREEVFAINGPDVFLGRHGSQTVTLARAGEFKPAASSRAYAIPGHGRVDIPFVSDGPPRSRSAVLLVECPRTEDVTDLKYWVQRNTGQFYTPKHGSVEVTSGVARIALREGDYVYHFVLGESVATGQIVVAGDADGACRPTWRRGVSAVWRVLDWEGEEPPTIYVAPADWPPPAYPGYYANMPGRAGVVCVQWENLPAAWQRWPFSPSGTPGDLVWPGLPPGARVEVHDLSEGAPIRGVAELGVDGPTYVQVAPHFSQAYRIAGLAGDEGRIQVYGGGADESERLVAAGVTRLGRFVLTSELIRRLRVVVLSSAGSVEHLVAPPGGREESLRLSREGLLPYEVRAVDPDDRPVPRVPIQFLAQGVPGISVVADEHGVAKCAFPAGTSVKAVVGGLTHRSEATSLRAKATTKVRVEPVGRIFVVNDGQSEIRGTVHLTPGGPQQGPLVLAPGGIVEFRFVKLGEYGVSLTEEGSEPAVSRELGHVSLTSPEAQWIRVE